MVDIPNRIFYDKIYPIEGTKTHNFDPDPVSDPINMINVFDNIFIVIYIFV